MGILPRNYSNEKIGQKIENINKLISKNSNANTVQFLDMFQQFVGNTIDSVNEKLIDPEYKFYLTKEGYQVWAETMDPLFKSMITTTASTTPQTITPTTTDESLTTIESEYEWEVFHHKVNTHLHQLDQSIRDLEEVIEKIYSQNQMDRKLIKTVSQLFIFNFNTFLIKTNIFKYKTLYIYIYIDILQNFLYTFLPKSVFKIKDLF